VTDPYIRLFCQARNLMEFVETVARQKAPEEEIAIHLMTSPDEFNIEKQRSYLTAIEGACSGAGMVFTWEFDSTGTLHARHIVTDTGWKISLDRGLDVFQRYDMNDAFSLTNRVQESRPLKAFEVTYLRMKT
jgi:ATP-dependent Lon protease